MQIKNLRRHSEGVRCDRNTIYGNPFDMRNERERNAVCDGYEKYFWLIVDSGKSPRDAAYLVAWTEGLEISDVWKRKNWRRTTFMKAINVLKPEDTLNCWCAPKRCHCETLINFVEQNLVQAIAK